MKKIIVSTLLFVGILLVSRCGQQTSSTNQSSTDAPKVISTFPVNGAQDVDPSTSEIWVKFDKAMKDKSWSWAYANKNEFPELNGDPNYVDNFTKCNLPVKLESNKEYVIWVNMENHSNFMDQSGIPSAPYKFTFKTK